MRPSLIDFSDDGSGKLYIDKAVYAMPEMAALVKLFGKHYVDLLARLYMYRTYINPYATPAEREARALADCQTINKCSLDPTVLDSDEWEAAVARFNLEKYDSLVDSFVISEAKVDEFNRAIAATPVLELVSEPVPKGKVGRSKKPVADKVFDQMQSVEVKSFQRDNTESLKNMAQALKVYQQNTEELRKQVLKERTGKAQRGAGAQDYRHLLGNSN